jgi:hypothetical protein
LGTCENKSSAPPHAVPEPKVGGGFPPLSLPTCSAAIGGHDLSPAPVSEWWWWDCHPSTTTWAVAAMSLVGTPIGLRTDHRLFCSTFIGGIGEKERDGEKKGGHKSAPPASTPPPGVTFSARDTEKKGR